MVRLPSDECRHGAVRTFRPKGRAADAERVPMKIQGCVANSPSWASIRQKLRRAVVQREKGDTSASAPPPRAVAESGEDDGRGWGARALERPPVRS